MKIGLVGESPNDTTAFANLFRKRYADGITFFTLIPDVRGSQLDEQKTKHLLRKQYQIKKPDVVLFIRDLDQDKNAESRKQYYTEFKSVVDNESIYLLNVYELEALILADLDTFNAIYNTSLSFSDNPMTEPEPKEWLIERTQGSSKYNESKSPEIFSKLNFDKLLTVQYFDAFSKQLETLIKN
jgi:hypothetical protein